MLILIIIYEINFNESKQVCVMCVSREREIRRKLEIESE